MAWDDARRDYHFGAAGCTGNASADIDFLERYCAPDRLQRNAKGNIRRISGTATRLAGVPLPLACCVISQLTVLAPYADHATPGWNWPEELLPAVVLGHVNQGVRIAGLRCGLWVHGGDLYFWVDRSTIAKLGLPATDWVPYGKPAKDGEEVPILRYPEPLTGNRGICVLPAPVVACLNAFAGELPHSRWQDGPLTPRQTCATRSPSGHGVPDGDEDPDDAADEEVADLSRDTEINPDESLSPRDQVALRGEASGVPGFEAGAAAAVASGDGMLGILREALLARIRTRLPAFGQADLDALILATGYGPAKAPQSDIADLVFVMAASITNAAGGRPNWQEFAPAVVQAMRAGGALGPHGLAGPVTVSELAGWLAALLATPPTCGWSQRMARFLVSADKIARGLPDPVALDASIISGLVGFCAWLQANYGGDARALHKAMAATALPGHHLVLGAMAQLEQYPGIGVAVAANFLKDSQVPPMVGRYRSPSAMAAVEAGWSAKPDLHVLRILARITRDIPLHAGRKRQSLRVAVTGFAEPPLPGFPPVYPALASRRAEYRAIVDIHHWAEALRTSALEIERVLYLLGATRVQVATAEGGFEIVNAAWYRQLEAVIQQALAKSVPRMS